MAEKDLKALAAELQERLPVQEAYPKMNVNVYADEEGGCIHCEPAKERPFGLDGSVVYVKEIALFAEYHGLSAHTYLYTTGTGLVLL